MFLGRGPGVDVNAEVFRGFFGILGGFGGAEWSFYLDVIAFLHDARVARDTDPDEGEGGDPNYSDQYNRPDDDEDCLESAARCRGRSGARGQSSRR